MEAEVNFADTNKAKMHIRQLLLGWERKQTRLQGVVQYITHGYAEDVEVLLPKQR